MTGWLRNLANALWGGSGEVSRQEASPAAFRLLTNESVQQELGLNIEQLGMIGKYTREARQKHRRTHLKIRALDPDKRRDEMQKLMATVAQEVLGAIHEAKLLPVEQQIRLQQIVWQNGGVIVFTDPAVAKLLRLTEGQREMVLNILEDSKKKVRELMQGTEGTPSDEVLEKRQGLRNEALEKVLGILTDEQKSRWEEAKGARFENNTDAQDSAPATEPI